jgi:hypothetical protein
MVYVKQMKHALALELFFMASKINKVLNPKLGKESGPRKGFRFDIPPHMVGLHF